MVFESRKRNVENMIRNKDIEGLTKAMDDENQEIKMLAMAALGRMGEPGLERLIKAFENHNGIAAFTLGSTGGIRSIDALIKGLGDENVHHDAILGLHLAVQYHHDPRAAEALKNL